MTNDQFKAIYDTHSRALYNYILWMTKSGDASKDVLQTVFIRVWNCASLPDNEDHLRRWLFTAARNACLDTFRAHSRLSRLRSRYNSEDFTRPDEPAGGVFWDLLSECSETERCILYLHLKMGYSYGEIGTILGMTEGHARIKMFRAIKRLRQLLCKEHTQ
jgi:RNA polymerase sigma-70 factor, ECF subfamily